MAWIPETFLVHNWINALTHLYPISLVKKKKKKSSLETSLPQKRTEPITIFFSFLSPSAASHLLLWPFIFLACGCVAHPHLRVREIVAGMVRSRCVAHPHPLSPFSFPFVLSWLEPAEPPLPPFCFIWFCFLSFSSVPIMFRWASPEPRGGSWL